MLHDSLPPFIRGVGTVLILTAAIVSFAVARRAAATPVPPAPIPAAAADARLVQLAAEVEALRAEAEEDVAEEVLRNPWFECLSFVGTGLIAASFFAEWRIRRQAARR